MPHISFQIHTLSSYFTTKKAAKRTLETERERERERERESQSYSH